LRAASLELLAPRADVWAFVAEPYHLTDWWPGLTGVEPDRLGFAPGARWKAIVRVRSLLLGSQRKETLLLVKAVEPYGAVRVPPARDEARGRRAAPGARSRPHPRHRDGESRRGEPAAHGGEAALRPRPDRRVAVTREAGRLTPLLS
jgi:hypothetical protein